MIVTENIIINGREFTRTWSDKGMQIERDGVFYDEANDPTEFGRTYTETATPSESAEANEADYLAALNRLGVSADE